MGDTEAPLPAWNVVAVDGIGPSDAPSRAEFDNAVRLIEKLSMRLTIQSETIDTVSARIDQLVRGGQP